MAKTKSDEYAYIGNPATGPTVFTFGTGADAETFQWEGKGDRDGLDVQMVPEHVVKDRRFVTAIRKGLLFIDSATDDFDIEGLMKMASKQEQQLEAARSREVAAMVVDPNKNDIVGRTCVHPECQTNVLIQLKDIGDRPPLCPAHHEGDAFASKYIPTHKGVAFHGSGEEAVPYSEIEWTVREGALV